MRDWSRLGWRECTWPERGYKMLVSAAVLIFALAMGIGILLFIGITTDHIAEYNVDHDRCLRQAINGLEIARCR